MKTNLSLVQSLLSLWQHDNGAPKIFSWSILGCHILFIVSFIISISEPCIYKSFNTYILWLHYFIINQKMLKYLHSIIDCIKNARIFYHSISTEMCNISIRYWNFSHCSNLYTGNTLLLNLNSNSFFGRGWAFQIQYYFCVWNVILYMQSTGIVDRWRFGAEPA